MGEPARCGCSPVLLRKVYSLLFSRATVGCTCKGRNTTGEKAARRPQAQTVITSPLRSGSGKEFWWSLGMEKDLEETVFPFDLYSDHGDKTLHTGGEREREKP